MSEYKESLPVPRTPSKKRMDAIREGLATAHRAPDSRGMNEKSLFPLTGSSISDGKRRRDDAIKAALASPGSNDSDVFRSSQLPPSQYHIPAISSREADFSDEDCGLLTPPNTSSRNKRTRAEFSGGESEEDCRYSPSRDKGKNALKTHDSITSSKDATDDLGGSYSADTLTETLTSLAGFQQYVRSLEKRVERQKQALDKSNRAKGAKIHDLECMNEKLKAQNEELRHKLQQYEGP